MTDCRECGEPITFDDEHVSKRGKKIPLDPDSYQPHKCPNKAYSFSADDEHEPKIRKCYGCQAEIFFDEKYKGKSGKLIPLAKSNGKPHECPGKSRLSQKNV